MAVGYRKGFIYTLEAVIASSLILGMITVVAPEVTGEQDVDISNAESGIESLDKRGLLRDDLSTSSLENDIETYIPSGYNITVLLINTSSTSGEISSPGEVYLDEAGAYHELHLWINSASNLDATFDGEQLVTGVDGDHHALQSVDGTGYLNFTGSGTVHYTLESYSQDGNLGDYGEVHSINYVLWENGPKEIQVRIWRD